MPRRAPVRTACQQCRKSRAKCDGEATCTRCINAGLECSYDHRKAIPKETLRNEIKRLEKINHESDTLLNALGADLDSPVSKFILQALRRGESRESIALQVSQVKAKTEPDMTNASPSFSENDIVNSENGSSVIFGESTGASSVLSVEIQDTSQPVDPSSVSPTYPSIDPWTNSGWPKSYVRELIDSILGWDGMLFCLIRKDLFSRDFESGGTQFCSSALVNALLALGTRIKEQDPAPNLAMASSTQGSNLNSDGFLEAAVRLLAANGTRPKKLADIQALGLLALYEASSNHEEQAHTFADEYAAAITDVRSQESSSMKTGYISVRDLESTYCCAISLHRLLRLSQPHDYQYIVAGRQPPDHFVTLEGSHSLQQLTVGLKDRLQEYGRHEEVSMPMEHQQMAAKIFQLIEWIYRLRMQPIEPDFSETVTTYIKCLEWYNYLFTDGINYNDDPSARFAHLLYHYGILSMFAPFLDSKEGTNGNVRPREICTQAAQNILALALPHRQRLGFRESLGLTPRFISAALCHMVNEDHMTVELSHWAQFLP